MTGTQKFVLAALALVTLSLGAAVLLSGGNDMSSTKATTTTTPADPADTDQCFQETAKWVSLIVDNNASNEVFISMVKQFGQNSERYKAILRIYPAVAQEQIANGSDAAFQLMDQLTRAECNLVEPVD